jgi:putative transcriptional regulator
MNNKLKELRKKRKVKVAVLARMLDISESYYYKREKGNRKSFSIEEAKILADFYKLSIDELFFENQLDESSIELSLTGS